MYQSLSFMVVYFYMLLLTFRIHFVSLTFMVPLSIFGTCYMQMPCLSDRLCQLNRCDLSCTFLLWWIARLYWKSSQRTVWAAHQICHLRKKQVLIYFSGNLVTFSILVVLLLICLQQLKATSFDYQSVPFLGKFLYVTYILYLLLKKELIYSDVSGQVQTVCNFCKQCRCDQFHCIKNLRDLHRGQRI